MHDPKELGIPNICFSLNELPSREERFKKQRMERGFDDSETWSLTDTVANFTIPRLERYLEVAPQVINLRERDEIEKFLTALRLIVRDQGARIWTDEEREIVKEGLKHFPNIFLTLWW